MQVIVNIAEVVGVALQGQLGELDQRGLQLYKGKTVNRAKLEIVIVSECLNKKEMLMIQRY